MEKGSETEPAFSPAPTVYCYADVENRTIALASGRGMMPLEIFGVLIRGFDNVDDPAMSSLEDLKHKAIMLRGGAKIAGSRVFPDLGEPLDGHTVIPVETD